MNIAEAIVVQLAAGGRVAAPVVIVVAHPDDETIGLGSRLRRFDRALLVHLTDGAPHDGHDAAAYGFASVADYAAAREAELAAALQVGGAAGLRRCAFGVPDKEAFRRLSGLTQRIADLLAKELPAAVFTHAYEGGHPDHDAAAFAVHTACRRASTPPAIIEMPFYHRDRDQFVTNRFLELSSRRRPGSTDPHPALRNSGPRPSPGRQVWEIILSADDIARKRRMIDCFVTQRWLLAQFDVGSERFRIAPEYDFTAPPHAGELHYETLGWGITGADWRRAAMEALHTLDQDRRHLAGLYAGGTPAVRGE
jgi:LmbE family N-acetylglucosaminyl deacetylase